MIISHLEVEDIAEKGSSNSQNNAYKILTTEKNSEKFRKTTFLCPDWPKREYQLCQQKSNFLSILDIRALILPN